MTGNIEDSILRVMKRVKIIANLLIPIFLAKEGPYIGETLIRREACQVIGQNNSAFSRRLRETQTTINVNDNHHGN